MTIDSCEAQRAWTRPVLGSATIVNGNLLDKASLISLFATSSRPVVVGVTNCKAFSAKVRYLLVLGKEHEYGLTLAFKRAFIVQSQQQTQGRVPTAVFAVVFSTLIE